MLWRTERRNRKVHERWWRVTSVRVKPRIPGFGSVGLRAVRRLTPKAEKADAPKVIPEVRKRKRLARAIGVLAFLVLAAAVWMGVGARDFSCLQSPCLPHGFRGHVLALEFPRTPGDVAAIVGDINNPNRAVMWRVLNRDYVFIGAYLVLYLLLAAVLARATSVFSRLLTGLAVVSAICAAGFDVLENVRVLRILEVPLANLDGSAVAPILDAAVIKWTFSFVTIALLSMAFRHNNLLNKTLRGLFLLTAAIGVVGLVFHPLLQLTSVPLLGGMLFLIYNGIVRPTRLIPDATSIRRADLRALDQQASAQ